MKGPVTLHQGEPLAKSSKTLQRVHRVHRTLERKMSVKAFEQHYCLIDNARSLPCCQRFGLGHELIHSDAGSK
jgi:hypothetical protein